MELLIKHDGLPVKQVLWLYESCCSDKQKEVDVRRCEEWLVKIRVIILLTLFPHTHCCLLAMIKCWCHLLVFQKRINSGKGSCDSALSCRAFLFLLHSSPPFLLSLFPELSIFLPTLIGSPSPNQWPDTLGQPAGHATEIRLSRGLVCAWLMLSKSFKNKLCSKSENCKELVWSCSLIFNSER